MVLKDAIRLSTGAWPERGVKGIEGDWLEVGKIAIKTCACVVDTMIFTETDGVVVHVPIGKYLVEGKIMNYDGHLRVSRIRAYLGGTAPRIAQEVGKVAVDAGNVGICDVGILQRFDEQQLEESYDTRLDAIPEGGDVVMVEIGKQRIEYAVCESGFGDGYYSVYSLAHDGEVVGVEVEFLTPDVPTQPPTR